MLPPAAVNRGTQKYVLGHVDTVYVVCGDRHAGRQSYRLGLWLSGTGSGLQGPAGLHQW